nr:MAG TPA: hypothetical protein [Caudoviricetes sp.]DAG34683.1 MAG TPA: hypothetical protein [Caudoviricetes sp.]DAH15581.1 MAG TPA: hypothetical protein [Caudoviricetes sp.]DAJ62219.1 MAG TPA: hypothetical protein [Caudoviricetes sp.]DAN05989.1 MAG TPA: hypothetical protein [Caudoviricetes sp.]
MDCLIGSNPIFPLPRQRLICLNPLLPTGS